VPVLPKRGPLAGSPAGSSGGVLRRGPDLKLDSEQGAQASKPTESISYAQYVQGCSTSSEFLVNCMSKYLTRKLGLKLTATVGMLL